MATLRRAALVLAAVAMAMLPIGTADARSVPTTELVSVSDVPYGWAAFATLSATGRFVAYETQNEPDHNQAFVVVDRETGARTIVDEYSDDHQPDPGGNGASIYNLQAITPDGRFAVQRTGGSVFRVDTLTGERVAVAHCRFPGEVSISDNGALVGILDPFEGCDGKRRGAYVADVAAGTLRRVATTGTTPQVSGDGNFFALVTPRPRVPADTDDLPDAYVLDLRTNIWTLISTNTPEPVDRVRISADGSRVAFTTAITAIDPIVVVDRTTGERLVAPGRGDYGFLMSANGRFVESYDVRGGVPGILVGEVDTGASWIVTVRADGGPPEVPSPDPASLSAFTWHDLGGVSNDGSTALFSSRSSDLAPDVDDGPYTSDVFVRIGADLAPPVFVEEPVLGLHTGDSGSGPTPPFKLDLSWKVDETLCVANVLRSQDGGPPEPPKWARRTPDEMVMLAKPDHRYDVTVDIADCTGNATTFAIPEYSLQWVRHDARRVVYAGRWHVSQTATTGGVHISSRPGSSAELSFRGQEVGVVMSPARAGCKYIVIMDGVRVGRFFTAAASRTVAYVGSVSSGSHTIQVVVPRTGVVRLAGFELLR